MSESRINLAKAVPELYKSVEALERQVGEASAAAGIDKGFSHLLRLRASQINQCAYCVRLHTRDAIASGESSDRISVVAAWRESQYFTAEERQALALIESITLISEGQIPDSVYGGAAAVLSDNKIAAVESIGIVINVWNRIAIASRYAVEPS